MLLGKGRPGAILLAFLMSYGIAGFGDGIVGVPWADLTGTSLDERWRARMFGLMTAVVGIMMLGLAPVIGVPLPLFSYGGSALVSALLGIGFLMNVSMRRYVF